MQVNLETPLSNNSSTYQHLHGIMLVNLNKLAYELKLSHSEYHLMGVLIGYWNKQQGKSYPTVKLLAQYARMSNSTVLTCLKRLTNLGLIMIVKDTKTNRQTYYVNQQKFLNVNDNSSVTHEVLQDNTPCSNAHEQTNRIKHIRNKTFIKHSCSKNFNDDESILKTNTNEYKYVAEKLSQWHVHKADIIIKEHGISKLTEAIKLVEAHNPHNPGGYLRVILNNSNISYLNKANKTTLPDINTPIELMLKYKYWRHIPTQRIYIALPDVGSHILIRYNAKENKVTFIENDFTDRLDNFEPTQKEEYICQNAEQINNKPTREEIIKKLLEENKFEEAKALNNLWKMHYLL